MLFSMAIMRQRFKAWRWLQPPIGSRSSKRTAAAQILTRGVEISIIFDLSVEFGEIGRAVLVTMGKKRVRPKALEVPVRMFSGRRMRSGQQLLARCCVWQESINQCGILASLWSLGGHFVQTSIDLASCWMSSCFLQQRNMTQMARRKEREKSIREPRCTFWVCEEPPFVKIYPYFQTCWQQNCPIVIIRNQESKMNKKDSSNLIVSNILAYSQQHGGLLAKYNLDFFLNYLDRDTILEMADYIQPHQHLTVEEFVRIFLLKIEHLDHETLYLALSLKQFYESILERTASTTNYIEFSDFTTYLCEKISKQDLDVVIAPKKGSAGEAMDLEPTIITSKIHQDIPKISKELLKRNKKLQQKKGVSKFYYSQELKQVIAVGSLTSSVYLYDSILSEKQQLKPKVYRQMQKELAILSMGYSTRNNRIGALLTNGIMVFWEGCDQFATEKYISTRNCGDKIMYLQQANEWVTYDRSTIYFWDLKEEAVTRSICCRDSTAINDICEISHMQALCVSAVTSRQEKQLLIYHQNKRVARIKLQNSACHTLHYHKLTQSLIPLGYHNTLPVYSVSGVEFDTEMKFVLRGHKSIITCIDSVDNNTLLITGDDLGELRIWQLAYMRCVQSIKLSKWLGGIRMVGDRLYYSDSRINLMQLDHFELKTTEKEAPLKQFYDQRTETLWIITKKDARAINIKTGKVTQIYTLCTEQQEISAAAQLADGFVIGNSKGEVFRYDSDCNLKWSKMAHEGEVKQLLFDQKNRLIFSMGEEGSVIAWPERNTELEDERKRIVFRRRQVAFMSLSNSSNVLIVGSSEDKELTIWDYQTLKLFQILSMETPVTAIFTSHKLDLIIVATKDRNITLIKFAKKEQHLNLTRIYSFSPLSSQSEISKENEDQQISDLLLLPLNEDTRFCLIVSTNRGSVVTFDLSTVIHTHFVVEQPLIYESVNILRNQKEQFQSSYSQRGTYEQISTLPNATRGDTFARMLWSKKITKEGTVLLSQTCINQDLFGVICQEYVKLISISTGNAQASLNINQTLPIKWDLNVSHFASLKKNIYETLKILDTILRNNGYELLAREYKQINISQFIQSMKNYQQLPSLAESRVPIAEKQVLCRSEGEQPTLKSLQAYKRVKNIKKISEESMYLPIVNDSVKNKQSQYDKEQIADFLMRTSSINDVVTQIFTNGVERNAYIDNLESKLSESVILPHENKKIKTLKAGDQRRPPNAKASFLEDLLGRQLENPRKTHAPNKENILKWEKQAERQNVKQILGELNLKLKICRQNYKRDLEGESKKHNTL